MQFIRQSSEAHIDHYIMPSKYQQSCSKFQEKRLNWHSSYLENEILTDRFTNDIRMTIENHCGCTSGTYCHSGRAITSICIFGTKINAFHGLQDNVIAICWYYVTNPPFLHVWIIRCFALENCFQLFVKPSWQDHFSKLKSEKFFVLLIVQNTIYKTVWIS